MKILKVKDLTKEFKNTKALNNVSLNIEEGEVVGLIGPNGAGKTTLIKCILKLYKKDSGTISVCEIDLDKDFENVIKNIGVIVESPDMYQHLSGKKNLEIFSLMNGIKDDSFTEELVKLVKLDNRLKDKVKTYSLGMKQRLGIVQSLLAKPKLLILDEPTNGLDPNGIIELRALIKEINEKYKTTVLISSHNLPEVEHICTRVIMINNGEIAANLPMEEIKKRKIKLEDVFVVKSNTEDQLR
jgi:ABC-type multidrug transport system, ATPase component